MKFLNILKIWCPSPSRWRTVSTICSNSFGPAIVPCFVTWPIKKIGTCFSCANWTNKEVASLSWLTEPEILSIFEENRVWIESIIKKSGNNWSAFFRIDWTFVSFNKKQSWIFYENGS